jgi:hypothetical protein
LHTTCTGLRRFIEQASRLGSKSPEKKLDRFNRPGVD